MNMARIFLTTLLVLLVSSGLATEALNSKLSLESALNARVPDNSKAVGLAERRSLRSTNPPEDDNGNSLEERAGGVSSFFSNLAKKAKARWWLETGKSEKYAMEKLKLDKLSGAALTSHRNYKYFQAFVTKALQFKLNKMVADGVPTATVWTRLGLDKVLPDQIEQTSAFKIYANYVKQFDDNAMHMWGAYKLPEMVGQSSTEMLAKARLWGKHKRTDAYVKMALGLENLSGNALKSHSNYQYYTRYLDSLK